MKKFIRTFLVMAMVSAVFLTACGPSDEKLSEAETSRSLLLEAKESAESTYLDITDSSQKQKLSEMAQEVAEIEEIDFSKYSDKKIDETLPRITELTEEYQSLKSGFDATLKSETEKKLEAEKTMYVGAYLINKTGMNLNEVMLHDVLEDTYSDNLLGDGVILEAGYTLMGVVLDINKSSSEWEFVIRNENNTSFTLPCDSLEGASTEGISIILNYDESEKTGYAEVGNY